MTSIPKKQVNGNTANNGPLGKRKKTRESRGTYLSKWLDKTMHHIQESTPSMDTFESFANANLNSWSMNNNAQFPPNVDPCRYNLYGCAQEPMSLPAYPSYCTPPAFGQYTNGQFWSPDCRYGVQSVNKSIQVQRPRQKRKTEMKTNELNGIVNNTLSNTAYIRTSKAFSDSQDFASLPPIVTSVGDTTSNSDLNTNEKEDAGNIRRFSDPCVGPPVGAPVDDPEDSASETSSALYADRAADKLVGCLVDQINSLKLTNERLNKDLHDTRAELQGLRQQNSLWYKGSNSSLGASPNHYPLGGNGLLQAPTYTPGVLTDLVREIRDAARIREEALYSQVRTMMLERADTNGMTSGDSKSSDARTFDDIKSELRAAEADKRRMLERLCKLEDELRLLRLASGLESREGPGGGGAGEEAERLRLRRELADARRDKQHADEHALKLERLVTQMRSKFNGLQISNGPESLPCSEHEHDAPGGVAGAGRRRASPHAVVFGPVTDL